MRTIITATATAVTLLFFVAGSSPSQAAPVGPVGQQNLLKAGFDGIQKTQYFFGGRQYCWYPDGWHGPGWYWCGYAFRQGFGWGGGEGWRGWGRGGRGFGRPGPGFRPGFRPGPGGRGPGGRGPGRGPGGHGPHH